MNKFLLLDGNSILNRAYYGLSGANMLQTSDGIYTNAVFGFMNILDKFIRSLDPAYVAIAFDMKKPTFRHDFFKEYKAGRKPMPEELASQFPVLKEILSAMNISILEQEGYEADDILGTLACKAKDKGLQCIVVTGDRDMLQLVSEHCTVVIPTVKKGKSIEKEYTPASFREEFGISPDQYVHVKALMGDASDNIPGVKGIGEKTALELVSTHSDLHGIYEHLDSVSKPALREKLLRDKDNAFLSLRLARIQCGMDGLDDIAGYREKDFDTETLLGLFEKLEFHSFISRYGLKNNRGKLADHRCEIVSRMEDLVFADDLYVSFIGGVFRYTTDGLVVRHLEEGFACAGIQALMEKAKSISGHYLKDFMLHLMRHGIDVPPVAFDSATCAYLLDASRDEYPLTDLFETHAGVFFENPEQHDLDPLMIYHLRPVLMGKIRETDMLFLMEHVELPLIEVLAYMEFIGFRADKEFLLEFSQLLKEKIDQVSGEIFFICKKEFNLNSPKQLGVVLFEEMQIPAYKKTKTGYSTSSDVLEKLSKKHHVASLILEYRKLAKLKSTYADGLFEKIAADGRIHSVFKQTVTATGRISSVEPNMQNIPIRTELGREIRRAFIPQTPGFLLLAADYSQIELRLLAQLSGDKAMLDAFSTNGDIHADTAAKVFDIDPRMVTPDMRRAAKAVNFGIVYGISDYGLSEDLGIPVKLAQRYIEEYFAKYPGVRRYMNEVVESARKHGYARTIFNRRRYIPEFHSKDYNMREFGRRVAMNAPLQGSAADIIKYAMVKVFRTLKEKGMQSRLILQVHDELVIETHEDEVDRIKDMVRECMTDIPDITVPLKIDIGTGVSLYETK